MRKFTTLPAKSKAIIDRIEGASDTMTGLGGLSLFVGYLRNADIFPAVGDLFFGSMRRSLKSQPASEIFKQLFKQDVCSPVANRFFMRPRCAGESSTLRPSSSVMLIGWCSRSRRPPVNSSTLRCCGRKASSADRVAKKPAAIYTVAEN